MNLFTHSRRALPVAAVLIAALSAGCAGTAPKPKFSHELVAEHRIAASDSVQVNIAASDKVKILESEKARLAEKIMLKIADRKVMNAQSAAGKTYEVTVHLSRYEKGNAFARAMLAGLGQIHIDGTVDVLELPARTSVGQFDLNKTFAWGGVYGASMSIEDIEATFAEGVAAAVTGQQEAPKAAAKKTS